MYATTAESLQSCPTFCNPIDGSPPGCPIPGILQARTLEWVAISFSNAWKWKVKVKSCLTLSDPMDCSLPGSSIHGIFPGKSTGVGCHCLLWISCVVLSYFNEYLLKIYFNSRKHLSYQLGKILISNISHMFYRMHTC